MSDTSRPAKLHMSLSMRLRHKHAHTHTQALAVHNGGTPCMHNDMSLSITIYLYITYTHTKKCVHMQIHSEIDQAKQHTESMSHHEMKLMNHMSPTQDIHQHTSATPKLCSMDSCANLAKTLICLNRQSGLSYIKHIG